MPKSNDTATSPKSVEVELNDAYRVTLHTIEFHRNDESGEVERMIFLFSLHFGDGGRITIPVTVTEIDESIDETSKTASTILYEILSSLAETVRRKGNYPNLSFAELEKDPFAELEKDPFAELEKDPRRIPID